MDIIKSLYVVFRQTLDVDQVLDQVQCVICLLFFVFYVIIFYLSLLPVYISPIRLTL